MTTWWCLLVSCLNGDRKAAWLGAQAQGCKGTLPSAVAWAAGVGSMLSPWGMTH